MSIQRGRVLNVETCARCDRPATQLVFCDRHFTTWQNQWSCDYELGGCGEIHNGRYHYCPTTRQSRELVGA